MYISRQLIRSLSRVHSLQRLRQNIFKCISEIPQGAADGFMSQNRRRVSRQETLSRIGHQYVNTVNPCRKITVLPSADRIEVGKTAVEIIPAAQHLFLRQPNHYFFFRFSGETNHFQLYAVDFTAYLVLFIKSGGQNKGTVFSVGHPFTGTDAL